MKACRTYVMRGDQCVEVTDQVRAPPEPRVHILGDRAYENLSVPSFDYKERKFVPVDIGSRSKHQRYMKERGLTHVSDFNSPGGFWDQAAARRARIAEGTDPENNRRLEAKVVEAYKRVEAGQKPRPPESVDHDEHWDVPKNVKTGDVVTA